MWVRARVAHIDLGLEAGYPVVTVEIASPHGAAFPQTTVAPARPVDIALVEDLERI